MAVFNGGHADSWHFRSYRSAVAYVLFLPSFLATVTTVTRILGKHRTALVLVSIFLSLFLAGGNAWAQAAAVGGPQELSSVAWWVWPLGLFAACFVLGMIAVPAGIGGGTLFVPIIGGFFPFHLDFVRGAGLLVALSSALAAAPWLLRSGLASLRLALPLAVLASISSIAGALVGLALPASVVHTAMGVTVLSIAVLMLLVRASEFPLVRLSDPLATALQMNGAYVDGATGRVIEWKAHRTPQGLMLFLLIGAMGGLFGIGAGWANVPALNLLMGIPLKVAAGTSGLVLSLASSSGAWVYLDQGAIIPMIAIPSMAGSMLGARLGARMLDVLNPATVRRLVIAVLVFAGMRALLKGVGLWP